jgi:GTP-binding protein HflX
VITAGANVIDVVTQRRRTLDPATFVGRGKLDEIKDLVGAHSIDLVVCDDDLSPGQAQAIETAVETRVIDRSGVILGIFARHARTHEAKLQVELAQLEYALPRLTKMWTHLGRPGGGIGTRGPGETQLEVDRRHIRTRISRLKEKIARVSVERRTQRKGRRDIFRIALCGYTNAGKSTLFNALARADVLVADKLFATLDTTTRRLYLGPEVTVLLSDTVGFIRKLPHHLVASFRSTLQEVTDADLILHVMDASSPQIVEQIEAVDAALADLETRHAEHRLVMNKLDLTDEARRMRLAAQYPDAWVCSALSKTDVNRIRRLLLDAVLEIRESREAAGRAKRSAAP